MAMSQRSSLGSSSKSSSSRGGGGGGSSADKKKLILAVVLFVLAGGLIVWQQGMLDGLFRSPPKVDPVVQAQIDKDMKENKAASDRMVAEDKGIVGGE